VKVPNISSERGSAGAGQMKNLLEPDPKHRARERDLTNGSGQVERPGGAGSRASSQGKRPDRNWIGVVLAR